MNHRSRCRAAGPSCWPRPAIARALPPRSRTVRMRSISASSAASMPGLARPICISTTLPEVMSYLHGRGVKGYVTLNTLVFPSELDAIERTLIEITDAGVDAVLVQDLGLVRLIRADQPGPCHPRLDANDADQRRVHPSRGVAGHRARRAGPRAVDRRDSPRFTSRPASSWRRSCTVHSASPTRASA